MMASQVLPWGFSPISAKTCSRRRPTGRSFHGSEALNHREFPTLRLKAFKSLGHVFRRRAPEVWIADATGPPFILRR